MTTRWSPRVAGLVALVATCLVGIALATLAAQRTADPGERRARTRRFGGYAGIAASLAGAGAYLGQAQRGPRGRSGRRAPGGPRDPRAPRGLP